MKLNKIVWSYGGGTQSIAIALLVAKGKLPVPDRIVYADTGGEMDEVMDYLHTYINPLLKSTVKREVEIIPHSYAKVDFYRNDKLLIPAYTSSGKFPTYCSKEWKVYVIRRYLGGSKEIRDMIIMWLGMSTDEVHRIKESDVKYIHNHWPLCDIPRHMNYGILMSRKDCKDLIRECGYPTPPSSACVWCPNLSDEQWDRMKKYSPKNFEKAQQIQDMIYERDGQDGLFLHKSRQRNLNVINFNSHIESDDDDSCSTNMCFT
jgi:hypothetical protein